MLKHITIAGADVEVGDEIFIGGEHAAFRWDRVRAIEPCSIAVRLEGGHETAAPGRKLIYGPLQLGQHWVLDREAIAVRRQVPEPSTARPRP